MQGVHVRRADNSMNDEVLNLIKYVVVHAQHRPLSPQKALRRKAALESWQAAMAEARKAEDSRRAGQAAAGHVPQATPTSFSPLQQMYHQHGPLPQPPQQVPPRAQSLPGPFSAPVPPLRPTVMTPAFFQRQHMLNQIQRALQPALGHFHDILWLARQAPDAARRANGGQPAPR